MKTKFILHGGYPNEENELNNSYFAEMVKSTPNNGTILIVYFASKRGSVEEKYKRDSARLQSFAKNKTINIAKATERKFIAEVKSADVIYLYPGDTQKLKTTLENYPNFKETIKGKTVSGSSAGAYVLAKYYFTNSLNTVIGGFGCVPIRIVCHYKSKIHPVPEGANPIGAMEKHDTTLELILLKDYEWVVKEITT